MLERRWIVHPLLIWLAVLRAGCLGTTADEIALRPLLTNGVRLGDGLGLFHARPAQWTIEGGAGRVYLAGIWTGPADFDGDKQPDWAFSAPMYRRGKEAAGKVWVVSRNPTNGPLDVLPAPWSPTALSTGPMTNTFRIFPTSPATEAKRFYRAKQE